MFFLSALICWVSIMISISSLKFTFSRLSFWWPLSIFARVSSWEIIWDIFTDSFSMDFKDFSIFSTDSVWLRAYSLWEIMTDIGVRSSWDTSDVNWTSFSKEFCSLLNIVSKVFARVCSSSFLLPKFILWDKSFPAFIFSAVSLIFSIGLKPFFVIIYPFMPENIRKNGRIIREIEIIVSTAFSAMEDGTIPLIHISP